MATETNKDALLRAIDNADENTLRTVLKSMCQDSEVCRKEAMGRMVVSRKREIIELSDASDDDTQNKPNKKKTVELTQKSRFEKCETCEKTYDVTLNDNKACQTHEGQLPIPSPLPVWPLFDTNTYTAMFLDLLEIDPEYFPDDDQVEYEIHSINVETDWRRKAVPEGFRWQCCDEPLNGKPCLVQRHISKK